MLIDRTRVPILGLTFLLIVAVMMAACGGGEEAATTTPTHAATATPTHAATAIPTETATNTPPPAVGSQVSPLPNMIVAPHFVDVYPVHGDVLVQAPSEVLLNFNFNLHQDSAISVMRDGQPVSVGTLSISSNSLSMRTSIEGDAGDGVYQVDYKACWPDGSCHEGSTTFVVDGDTVAEYVDLRGQTEVTVNMMDEKLYDPPRMILSPGTKVTWLNVDAVAHFVNTDPHPSHNLQEEQNSLAINPGETHSYTFAAPGAWGYHCSAHFNLGMTAQVLVQ